MLASSLLSILLPSIRVPSPRLFLQRSDYDGQPRSACRFYVLHPLNCSHDFNVVFKYWSIRPLVGSCKMCHAHSEITLKHFSPSLLDLLISNDVSILVYDNLPPHILPADSPLLRASVVNLLAFSGVRLFVPYDPRCVLGSCYNFFWLLYRCQLLFSIFSTLAVFCCRPTHVFSTTFPMSIPGVLFFQFPCLNSLYLSSGSSTCCFPYYTCQQLC